ncbi:MAG: DUF4252 domain-containing protein [Bacteroidales bacterium]|jgi:hypothetical protein|nr:DUF4252 domain-containing protein [Bacteroidales bacterium]
MKKIISIAVIALISSVCLFAQPSLCGIYTRYAYEPGVESVHIGGLLMKIGKSIAKSDCDKNGRIILSSIKSLYVLDLSECREEVRNSFRKDIRGMRFRNAELLLQASDGSDDVKIYMDKRKGYITGLYILNGGEDPCLVYVKGKISNHDMRKLISEYGNKETEETRL